MKDLVLVYTVNNKGYHYALTKTLKEDIYDFLCELTEKFDGHPYVDIEDVEGLPLVGGIRSFSYQLVRDLDK